MTRRPYPKQRTLIISDGIDQKLVGDISRSIFDINHDDDEKEADYRDWKREPIRLMLNTYGGSVYDGIGLINAIELSRTPVHTYVMGSAMSMGMFILVAGHRRFAAPYSTIMYHQLSVFAWDKLEGIKDHIKEAERLEKVCEDILFRRSHLTLEAIENYKKQKSEWYITPEVALDLGIVDEILGAEAVPDPPRAKKKGKAKGEAAKSE